MGGRVATSEKREGKRVLLLYLLPQRIKTTSFLYFDCRCFCAFFFDGAYLIYP